MHPEHSARYYCINKGVFLLWRYCKAPSYQDVMAVNGILPMLNCIKNSQLQMIQVFWVVTLSSGVIYSDVSKEYVSFVFMSQGDVEIHFSGTL